MNKEQVVGLLMIVLALFAWLYIDDKLTYFKDKYATYVGYGIVALLVALAFYLAIYGN